MVYCVVAVDTIAFGYVENADPEMHQYMQTFVTVPGGVGILINAELLVTETSDGTVVGVGGMATERSLTVDVRKPFEQMSGNSPKPR